MKLFLIGFAFLATVLAQSAEYLPPVEESSASHVVETNSLESEPAHTLADDGYRYKTVKRFRLRHRRDVSELNSDYLPPHAESAPAPVYSAPVESAPAVSYESAPAEQSYEVSASEPAHTLSQDGYRYKTVKRYRLRHRRDVSELNSDYLPPHAESAPAPVYSAPVESAPAVSYNSAPAEQSYEVSASEPAHTLSQDGYRYKTVKRYRLRHRRDVSELNSDYLPPHAESAPAPVYSAPVESAPAVSYESAPAEQSYEVAASEPTHTLSQDGYRYKTVKRYRLRHRRDVSELNSDYLPPHAESAPAPVYSAPVESAPAVSYNSAPAEQSYEVAASEPAHTLSQDGYRYKTVKRFRLRHRRDVSELNSDYLPPHAESAPAPVYSAPVESAPAVSYESAPAEQSYEVAASEPAHTLSQDGYRYKTVKRYRLRHRRDVSELNSDYLPPHAESAPAPVYSAPVESAPAVSYESAPAGQSYEVSASEPAHTLSQDGYRYKTVKRYRYRHRH